MTTDSAPTPAAEIAKLRAALLECARKAEALKRDCSMDPESPQAVRNLQYQSISTAAHIALGTIRGPAPPAAAEPLSDEQIDALISSACNGCWREYDHDDARSIVRAALSTHAPARNGGEMARAWESAVAAPQPASAQVAEPGLHAEAAEMLEWYAAWIKRHVMSANIEEHPYLPELEDVAERLRAAAQPAAEPVAWQAIETAPADTLVVVGWLDAEDPETPERHDFDWCEDGCWMQHHDSVEHAEMVAPPGSRLPSAVCPYTHWMPLPPIPGAAPADRLMTAGVSFNVDSMQKTLGDAADAAGLSAPLRSTAIPIAAGGGRCAKPSLSCQNMKERENDTSMTHEHYDCKVCGGHIALDYDEMR